MADMTAFEHQVENTLRHAAGPSRPVDAVRVVELATASRWSVVTRRPRSGSAAPTEGGFSMFSALKFIAAGVIVALFGGFLLAGVLTTPNDDQMVPAAVTESPSPMTTEELLSGMVTEEVEPGVLRVVNDGVRDLSSSVEGCGPCFMVDVTPDGSVWLSGDTLRRDMFRLGEEPVFEDPAANPPYREVAPDGSLWGLGEPPDDREGIFSFDGEGWTVRATATGYLTALAVGPDGTVWATSGPALLRLEDDGSLTTIEDWSDVYDGDAYPAQLAVSPDGDVWLIGTGRDDPDVEALLRFDGEGWEAIPGPEGGTSSRQGPKQLGFDPDGTLWVNATYLDVGSRYVGGLARFDDPGWTTFTEADGVEPWGGWVGIWEWSAWGRLNVAADGSFWLRGMSSDGGCDGAAHYDGTTWTPYLLDSCVHDLAIAPDGGVWLRADAYDWDDGGDGVGGPVDTYVITPEAMTATN